MDKKEKEYMDSLAPKELPGESDLMMALSEELAEHSQPIGNPDDGLTQTDLRGVAQGLIKRGYNLQEQPSKSKLDKARGILFAYFNEHDYELLEDCLIALTPLFEPLEE